MHHIGYKFIPHRDDQGKVTSMTLFCICDYTFGGSMPKWLEHLMADQGIFETLVKWIEGTKNERMETFNDEYRKTCAE